MVLGQLLCSRIRDAASRARGEGGAELVVYVYVYDSVADVCIEVWPSSKA